ncbi:MAG TPA: hypothetical protein VE820_05580 [Sphingomicrobium sp.]|nr:hypothetical protein [Sphingomicrobium sp.]
MDSLDARSALAAKQHAEAQMAKAAQCPPWRHAACGLLMGGLIASFAFEFAIRTAILVIVLACIPIIIQSDRKRMGMFISGYRRGKTRLIAFGILALWLPLYGLSVYFGLERHDHVAPLLLGLVGFLITIAGSVIWQRVFVREMGA